MSNNPKNEPWRDLCAKVSVEQDPKKLEQLISELLRALDADDRGRTRRPQPSGFDSPFAV